MKKITKTAVVPPALCNYTANNPDGQWEEFRNNDRNGVDQVEATLRADQRGICVYCENNLAKFHGQGLDDFRVEHFHPKNRPPNPPPNWALDWQNLLAVCTGGNALGIGAPALFTSPDHSCDVPKGKKNLTGTILNPLTDIPPFPPLFEYDEDGGMAVSAQCPGHLKTKAEASIRELRLSPAADRQTPNPRLKRFRKVVIDSLREQLNKDLEGGMSESSATAALAQVYFPSPPNSEWPSFFGCIRWYLGPSAEVQLQAIGYNG